MWMILLALAIAAMLITALIALGLTITIVLDIRDRRGE